MNSSIQPQTAYRLARGPIIIKKDSRTQSLFMEFISMHALSIQIVDYGNDSYKITGIPKSLKSECVTYINSNL